jgi:hypothetical protein
MLRSVVWYKLADVSEVLTVSITTALTTTAVSTLYIYIRLHCEAAQKKTILVLVAVRNVNLNL